jgi:hypothetical protein
MNDFFLNRWHTHQDNMRENDHIYGSQAESNQENWQYIFYKYVYYKILLFKYWRCERMQRSMPRRTPGAYCQTGCGHAVFQAHCWRMPAGPAQIVTRKIPRGGAEMLLNGNG